MHLYLSNKSWILNLTLSFNVWLFRLSHIWPMWVIMLKPPVCIYRGTGAFVSNQYVFRHKICALFFYLLKEHFSTVSISVLHFFISWKNMWAHQHLVESSSYSMVLIQNTESCMSLCFLTIFSKVVPWFMRFMTILQIFVYCCDVIH